MLTVHPCSDRAQWTAFLDRKAPHTFLQSWEWKETHDHLGHKTIALGIFADHDLIGTALTIFMKAKRGSFLLVPHGPIMQVSSERREIWSKLVTEWKRLALELGAVCVRVCPLLPDDATSHELLSSFNFKPAPIHQHPELAWMLDLSPDEDALLKNMRKTTRQSIRKAEEAGMTVELVTYATGLKAFWQVYETTVARQHFTPFSRAYLEAECQAFASQGRLLIALGHVQNTLVSAALVVTSHGNAFYHHGASDQSHFPKIPAAHLLQWRIIQEIKRRGCRIYNFWGVVPETAIAHPWHGLSLFKRGFGGFEETYVHAQDLVLSKKYWLTWLIETLRKKQRRL